MAASERAVGTVLVVDDAASNLKLVVSALAADGAYRILCAVDGLEAQNLLRTEHVDVVVTDVMMPGLDGLELLRWARETGRERADGDPGPLWIIHSAIDTFDAAVEALKLGAFDYVAKPLRSVRLIQRTVRNAVHARQLEGERRALREAVATQNGQLAAQVRQLEELCSVLREQADTIQQDLDRAELIQRALLPRIAPRVPGFAIDSVYRPSRNIGGDGYDLVRLDDRHVALYIADAAGHGVAAAMLAVVVKHRLAMLDAQTGRPRAPADVLAALNRVLLEDCAAPGLFVTGVYCVLDTVTRELTLASAGHPPVAHQVASGAVTLLPRTGPALGLHGDARYTNHTIVLGLGDRLLLYTDGLCEPAASGAGVPLDADGIASALRTGAAGGHELLHALLSTAVDRHGGTPIEDDVTLLLLTATEGVSTLDHDHEPPSAHAVTATRQQPPELAVGERGSESWVRLCGRATWTHAAAFREQCIAARAPGREVVIDLGACSYLDSTVLGTLHELIATSAPDATRVVGVRAEVRALFDELAMQPVIDRIATGDHVPPTTMRPVLGGADGVATSRDHIMHAHEVLAALSDHNREQFQGVVDALRTDRR